MLIFQSGFSHCRGTDKQQPLTLCEYIVLPFGIVYIRSVSVVATHPTPYPILREFDKKDKFNNALRSLMSDRLSEVSCKVIIISMNQRTKMKYFCNLILNKRSEWQLKLPICSLYCCFCSRCIRDWINLPWAHFWRSPNVQDSTLL